MALQSESTLETLKQQLIEYVRLQLADEIIDIELDASHFEAAYRGTIGHIVKGRKTLMKKVIPSWSS